MHQCAKCLSRGHGANECRRDAPSPKPKGYGKGKKGKKGKHGKNGGKNGKSGRRGNWHAGPYDWYGDWSDDWGTGGWAGDGGAGDWGTGDPSASSGDPKKDTQGGAPPKKEG